MLWGGALMLVAIVLLLAYLDRPVQHVAAIIAGLGFGTFIDEIGKFVTADNDYFFRPAVALIYVVLVVVFIVGRTLVGRRRADRARGAGQCPGPARGPARPPARRGRPSADRGSARPGRRDIRSWWPRSRRYLDELPESARRERLVGDDPALVRRHVRADRARIHGSRAR